MKIDIREDTVSRLTNLIIEYPFEYNSRELTRMYTGLEKDMNMNRLEEHYLLKEDMFRDISRHLHKILSRSDFGGEPVGHALRKMEREYWPGLRNKIERNPEFTSWGTRRGTRYRHKDSRPMLPTSLISKICIKVLKDSGAEMNWRKIWNNSKDHVLSIHQSYENGSILSREAIEASPVSSMAIEMLGDKGEDHLAGPFKKQPLKTWFNNMYTSSWFWKSWPVIQRDLRNYAIRGSKRGLWISTILDGQDSVFLDQVEASLTRNFTESRGVLLASYELEMHRAIQRVRDAYSENGIDIKILEDRLLGEIGDFTRIAAS